MSESEIEWGECISDTYSGVILGEEGHSYYIQHYSGSWGPEMYSLYERYVNVLVRGDRRHEDNHIADFRHLENAKAFAEHIEKGGSTLLDVITQSPLWKNNVGD